MKRNAQTHKPGYVLVLALMIISVITLVVTSVVNRVIVFGRLSSTLVEREQARMLALSGIQIAIGQISQEPPAAQSNDKQQRSALSTALKKLEPLVNRWQNFAFSEDKDGVEGSCDLYIACENGKINMNLLYDFENKKFIKNDKLDGLKVLQIVSEKVPQGKELAESISALLKERGRPLQDLTEIFKDKKLKKLSPYLFPRSDEPITLFDLFTLETQKPLLQPWFLTKSLNTILGFKNQDKADRAVLDTLADQTKSSPNTVVWQQKWDAYLAPIYGKQYSTIVPTMQALFDSEFETSNFSIISYGKFGNVVVKVYAVVQKIEDKSVNYCIKKIYWI